MLRQRMTKRQRIQRLTVCFVLQFVLGHADASLSGQEPAVFLASSTVTSNSQSKINRWPHETNNGQFHIRSTVPIAKLEPSLPKLNSLPTELRDSLTISVAATPIHVVVLESREALEAYVKRLVPNAPSRRALYYRHRGPGLVLTYYSSAWLTDARHECTHALLDASGLKLQPWLDEGLAEYFETASGNPLEHGTHRVSVQSQLRFGQVPDIEQLEGMNSNAELSAKDYRDAWSITAFLLNSSVQSKNALQSYLSDLQNERAAGFLSHRLKPSNHLWRDEFARLFRK